jgi:hypothetical protein
MECSTLYRTSSESSLLSVANLMASWPKPRFMVERTFPATSAKKVIYGLIASYRRRMGGKRSAPKETYNRNQDSEPDWKPNYRSSHLKEECPRPASLCFVVNAG